MNADMKDYISRCERRRNFEISNQKETLMPHELSVGGTKITELRYADDTALFSTSTTPEGLNNLVQAVNKHSAAYKLSINAAKTEILGPLLFIIYINDLYGK